MRGAVTFALLVACGSATPPPRATRHDEPATFTTETERRALFESLVADVRPHHVFAEATQRNLGRTWNDDLPALEQEFLRAKTEEELVVALTHFVNALHDGHCVYEPESHGEARRAALTLGVRADFEWRGDHAWFYVARVEDSSAKYLVEPGDEIRSVDGVPASELVTRYMNVSHQNNLRSVARDVAEYLSRRRPTQATTAEGSASTWVVRARKTNQDVSLTLHWGKSSSHDASDEFAIDYDTTWCSTLAARDYGPYELTARGQNFCVYRSQVKPYADHPIVRQFSFMYDASPDDGDSFQHRVRADHDLLAQELTRTPAKGVILDLRDNGGGNNPNWFMDWYASGSYTDRFVLTRLSPDLNTAEKLRAASVGHVADYLKQLAARTPDQTFTAPRPFFCKHGDCSWDNRYTPSHRVTSAPIALLVGSRCASSCDSVASLFAENHFGPLVGEPTAAAYTTTRLRRPITLAGKPFGAVNLAFTRELSGKTHEAIEGVPLHIDVPVDRTFANRDGYDRALVDAAIKALSP